MSDLSQLPSVDRLLRNPVSEDLISSYGREWTLSIIRQVLTNSRAMVESGMPTPSADRILSLVEKQLRSKSLPSLRSIINATGVLLHTNLGRAPLSQDSLMAIRNAAAGYSTLEYDLRTGKRGKRDTHLEEFLTRITGAEAAIVVNNNAGAVLLILSALARRKKVAISRSQLIEIGGGFRIPDIIRESGAKLMEVGTTNRTHLQDFETAISQGASVVMSAHHSNFKIVGFSQEPELSDLSHLARANNLPFVFDLGSGALLDTSLFGLPHEPTVQEAIRADCDLVCFSGDKLFGGPQAGIIVGKKIWLDKIRKHPLYRALRPDKLCLVGLCSTAFHYLKGEAEEQIPIYQMLSRSSESIKRQAEYWQQELGVGEIIAGFSTIGGGSLPAETLPTWLLSIKADNCDEFMEQLRDQPLPIIARILDKRVVFDPRTILPEEEELLLLGIQKALSQTKENS